ncbi:DNA polymerase [Cognatiyoonia sp. IB215446]|uniref:DNA polymerase n=1 Tax=Cognatiyoonia sp. IB215446 TaxID=3097355 RepID=UPI002A0F8CFA|nr:DNA polymerase [Cognatiyoonia sp. IB215446]MDX8346513.1 DNA polymerase [Cognatiyoonia sp. IB215446]
MMEGVVIPATYDRFATIWVVDTEFVARDGDRPDPVCVVAQELRSGREERVWLGTSPAHPIRPIPCPYDLGDDALFVSFTASAELGVHLAQGWAMPCNVLDLYVEHLRITNGRDRPCGTSLLGVMASYGIGSMSAGVKDACRDLIMVGGPWDAQDQIRILDYCAEDVVGTCDLFGRMVALDHIDLDRALVRGRYMAAVARMEWAGIPMDHAGLANILDHRDEVRDRLITQVDADYGVYTGHKFNVGAFQWYLMPEGIAWPRLPSGRLKLDDDTFKDRASAYPQLQPLYELRRSLSGLQTNRLQIGRDGRNRAALMPFAWKTGRNQPSNSRFIFGQSAWWRSFIRADVGCGLAYLDWDQQEFGIAAALSGDEAMKAAYQSGDPYLAFAKQAGAVPEDGTKDSHPSERDMFKACVLAVQYGMGAEALGGRIDQPAIAAQDLLLLHRRTYHQFWSWSDQMLETALMRGWIETVFGWRCHLPVQPNDRSIRNFPMQANGAEMLRLACINATEAGIEVCAPVHDAVLIHGPLGRLDADIDQMKEIMTEASRVVLDGFAITAGVEQVCHHPDRFMDKRGAGLWSYLSQWAA